jgi:sodium-independent sulfate anion transporter 11
MSSGPILLDYEEISYAKEIKTFAKKIPPYFKRYLSNLLPIIYWIHRYNLTWLVSDVIAGVTVGIVAVPQGMGYAKIANLSPVIIFNFSIHRIWSEKLIFFFYIYL